jgi:type VI secretion system secreted protein Hcp
MAKSDMFLSIDGQKTGTVNGGSTEKGFERQIHVSGWSWGMKSPTVMGGTAARGRRTLSELRIKKAVDTASTALMSILSSNETIKKAVLTIRKAGGVQIDFLTITLERARINAYDVGCDNGPEFNEEISIVFEKIEITYHAQDEKGGKKGGSTFQDEVLAVA